ncbi:ROK family protein [Microbacterium sp. CPCC 204701]|uniref:ROK family protein n=1 Tax=Microbacterium sp. CPCC 204701 TaxID=2493084 RepID=UPI0013E290A0
MTLRGNDVATLRRINSRAVLRELHFDDGGARSVTELAKRVGLSRPTVEAALADLAAEGWVEEISAVASPHKAGRPARRYRFAARAGVVVGIDLGPHTIAVIVADLRGEPLHIERRSGLDLSSGDAAWSAIHELTLAAIRAARVTPAGIRAITAGVPAIVDADGDIALTTVVPDWLASRLPERLRHAFPTVRVFFDNDAKLATLAETEWGCAADVENAVFLLAGHRLTAGLIVNGKVIRGRHGGAGEIGANAVVGWEHAVGRFRERIGDSNVESVLDAAAREDPASVAAVTAFADDIATGLGMLILAIDPQIVVVGGGFARAGVPLLEALEAAVRPQCLFMPAFALSSVGVDAVARGGVAHSLTYVRVSQMELTVA